MLEIRIDHTGFKKRYSLDKIKVHSAKSNIVAEVSPEGPTRVICFKNASSANTNKHTKISKSKEDYQKLASTTMLLDIGSIGISLIDKVPQV